MQRKYALSLGLKDGDDIIVTLITLM